MARRSIPSPLPTPMKFSNLRIAARLWLAVAILFAALAALVAYAAWRAEDTRNRANSALETAQTRISLATRWAGMTEAAVDRLLITAVSQDTAVNALVGDATKKAIAEINVLQERMAALPQRPEETQQMARIAELRKNLLSATAAMDTVRSQDASPEARTQGAAAISAAARPYLDAQAAFVRSQERHMEEVRAEATADGRKTLVIAGIVVALILGGAIVGVFGLVRSIRQPLQQGVELAQAIAAGDLTRRGDGTRRDEFGELMRALNAMSDALGRTVGEVRNAADQIATGSSEIAIGSQDLSQRTEEQASSLQQTAASMQQLGSTVRSSADSAREASELAGAASKVAVEGGAAVTQVVQTMEAISEASRRIADIIGTIDGIAFQTNILALNAAVEAARAGEQGRGFAVVASEVRSLAHRAGEAAKEIRTLIQDSVSKVGTGSEQVAQAGRTMGDVVAQVQRVTDLIGTISAATGEQTTGIGQVGHAVTQLDQVTQQNAALVEQSAAAAASLSQQATRLVAAVGVFKLGEQETRAVIERARAAAALPAPAQRTARTPARAQPAAAADDDWQQF